MPAIQKQVTQRNGRRSIRVTSRQLASPCDHAACGLDPWEEVRSFVPLTAPDARPNDRHDGGASFVDSTEELKGRTVRPVERLRSEEYHGYPLRRAVLVVFNRDGRKVTAELKEVAGILKIRGVGMDEESALRDLEVQFEKLVREKVRVPPHVREKKDLPLVLVINCLVDWKRFDRENPLPTPLWGQVLKHRNGHSPRIRWLLGPNKIRKQTTPLPASHTHPFILELPEGQWFKGVVKEYPDRIEWVEPPYRVPDPTDPEERRRAWEAIPTIYADQPGVWPVKGE
jgi:hypothetical protein